MKNVLSPTRKKILEYLNKETANNRFPSVREICNATGLKSTSTVHSHLKVLEQNGYISRLAGHRSIRMTGAAASVSVPVVGRVTAGLPVYAFEDVTGHIPFPAEKASGNVQIPGEGEEKQITVAGVEVKTKSASTYNTSVPHIDERVAPTTPSEVSASISVSHSVDIKT